MGYRNNNKYDESNNVIINQTVARAMSKYFCSKSVYHVTFTKIPSIALLSFKSIEKLSKLAL